MEISKDSIWKFEDKMGFAHSTSTDHGDEMAGDFYGAYLYHQENYPNMNLLWYRFWNLVIIEGNMIIGGVCFKGCPNENGEVEIGYGIDDYYQKQGYATEAIRELVKWAHEQDGVRYVMAETLKENIASQKVLQKINMVRYSENDENYYWKL
jgi:ribosomal-protein-alanine N-acetyltransferase